MREVFSCLLREGAEPLPRVVADLLPAQSRQDAPCARASSRSCARSPSCVLREVAELPPARGRRAASCVKSMSRSCAKAPSRFHREVTEALLREGAAPLLRECAEPPPARGRRSASCARLRAAPALGRRADPERRRRTAPDRSSCSLGPVPRRGEPWIESSKLSAIPFVMAANFAEAPTHSNESQGGSDRSVTRLAEATLDRSPSRSCARFSSPHPVRGRRTVPARGR